MGCKWLLRWRWCRVFEGRASIHPAPRPKPRVAGSPECTEYSVARTTPCATHPRLNEQTHGIARVSSGQLSFFSPPTRVDNLDGRRAAMPGPHYILRTRILCASAFTRPPGAVPKPLVFR